MSRHVLLVCYETPGYGGASTATYALFERMQADGLQVSYLNLIDAGDEAFLRAQFGTHFDNPRQRANVHTHRLEGAYHRAQPALTTRLRTLAPDVILAVGYIAALACKQAAPQSKVVFFTAGCDQIDRYLWLYGDATRVCEAMRADADPPLLFHAWERRAVDIADLILVHSPLVRELFAGFYPYHVGKLYPTDISMGAWIGGATAPHTALARPFASRDIDLLFVASRWDRHEKNAPMMRAITDACADLSVHVVGLAAPPTAHAVQHGLITSPSALFDLMGRSKVVLSPSLFDAAPGILFEADALGANIVASRNCGNSALCHPALLVEDRTAAGYVRAARLGITREFRSDRDIGNADTSYTTLLDLCAVS